MYLERFKKHKIDFIVLACIVLVGILIGICLLLFEQDGNLVQVRVAGEIVDTYSLSVNGSYTIQGVNGGTNVLVIQDGSARVTEASCPDGLCVNMGSISKTGQSIVCLPNQVVVEIISSDTDTETADVDVTAG